MQMRILAVCELNKKSLLTEKCAFIIGALRAAPIENTLYLDRDD